MNVSHSKASLILILVLLLFSAFFSGSETALISFRKMRLKHLVRKGHKGALLVDRLLRKTDRLLATILVGNNLVNVAASVLTGVLAIEWLEPIFGEEVAMLVATLAMTFLLLIFAEITPKTYSALHAERVSFWVARPIYGFSILLHPFVTVTTLISNFFLRVFLRIKPEKTAISTEEIRSIISYGEEEGVLEKEKREMLHGIFDISQTMVKEVMVPRPDIVAIEVRDPVQEILKKIETTGHSRYPVYQDQIDNIVGFLFVKDLIAYWARPETFELNHALRSVTYVPETKRVDLLLGEFRREQRQMSMVADEYGSVAGLVTMEDLLEEITGEIQDEYDIEAEKVERLADGSMILDGSLTLDEVYESTRVKLPEGEYETVAGFLLEIFGKIPKESEVISFGQFLFAAHKVVRHRILKVKIKPIAARTVPKP